MGGVCSAGEVDVWIGTTTPKDGLSKGIYHATFDTEKGKLAKPRLAAEIVNPGFVILHPDGKVLYSTGALDGEPVLAAYEIDRKNGRPTLSLKNSQPTGDGGACHLATDRTGKTLMSVQYFNGSVAVFPLDEDGSIRRRMQLIKHEGATGEPGSRQDRPHPHWIGTSPDNRFVFVPDLGLDKIVVYGLDAERSVLSPRGFGRSPAGAGPRHMKFHPGGKFIYLLNEMGVSVTTFAYDAEKGSLTPLQTIRTISPEERAKETFVTASEIRVHPSGQFVYAANRRHDTITALRVNPEDGKLSVIECEPVRGSWPRNFNVDPTGKWLLAAGRDSNSIAIFAIDQDTGELTFTGASTLTPTPICVTFGPEGN